MKVRKRQRRSSRAERATGEAGGRIKAAAADERNQIERGSGEAASGQTPAWARPTKIVSTRTLHRRRQPHHIRPLLYLHMSTSFFLRRHLGFPCTSDQKLHIGAATSTQPEKFCDTPPPHIIYLRPSVFFGPHPAQRRPERG